MAQQKTQTKIERTKSKIIIVDDHPILREGLAELINQEKDLVVCGQAEDACEAMKVIKALKPDVVIVDITLKETSGMELIKDIKIHYPNLHVLVLSMHDESLYAERVLRAGAKGYIMKREGTEKIVTAIRKVLEDQLYISEQMTARMVRKLVGGQPEVQASPIDCLSDRELEVFTLLGQGRGTRHVLTEAIRTAVIPVKRILTERAGLRTKNL